MLEAYRYKRLLLIWWQKPKPLEDFLVPPDGGVDWRVPDWLKPRLLSTWEGNEKTRIKGDKVVIMGMSYGIEDADNKLKNRRRDLVRRLSLQIPDGGEDFYAQHKRSHSTYPQVFHELFRTFFTPVPRLQTLIDSKMKEHNLIPGEYAATHLRAMYGNRKWRDPNETIALSVNGINCASSLYPGAPVYFAADIKFAVEVAREYGRQRHLPVGSLDFLENPIHFDRDPDWRSRQASDYDDTFVDLFMLGQSRCVTHSNGGYGSFGSLLSYDASCNIRYFKGRNIQFQQCSWTNPDGSNETLSPPEMQIPPDLMHEPK